MPSAKNGGFVSFGLQKLCKWPLA